VKEQTAGTYAARLAEHGLVTLAFDVDLYDKPGFVGPAVERLATFFTRELAAVS
jgi:fermentation-respiration switch protein FrsA (DUF1100 family)